jgi:hypothetical protein
MKKNMTVQESKDILKERYLKAGLKLEKETLDTLYFSYETGRVKISKDDIERYSAFCNQKEKFQTSPCECSLINNNYREQMVLFLNWRNRLNGISRKNPFVFGEVNSNNIYLEISYASENFINYFRFQEQYIKLCLPVLGWPVVKIMMSHMKNYFQIYIDQSQ